MKVIRTMGLQDLRISMNNFRVHLEFLVDLGIIN